jgi:hypothetical protein
MNGPATPMTASSGAWPRSVGPISVASVTKISAGSETLSTSPVICRAPSAVTRGRPPGRQRRAAAPRASRKRIVMNGIATVKMLGTMVTRARPALGGYVGSYSGLIVPDLSRCGKCAPLEPASDRKAHRKRMKSVQLLQVKSSIIVVTILFLLLTEPELGQLWLLSMYSLLAAPLHKSSLGRRAGQRWSCLDPVYPG